MTSSSRLYPESPWGRICRRPECHKAERAWRQKSERRKIWRKIHMTEIQDYGKTQNFRHFRFPLWPRLVDYTPKGHEVEFPEGGMSKGGMGLKAKNRKGGKFGGRRKVWRKAEKPKSRKPTRRKRSKRSEGGKDRRQEFWTINILITVRIDNRNTWKHGCKIVLWLHWSGQMLLGLFRCNTQF